VKSKSLPYVAPFALFVALLALHSVYPLPDLADQILRIAVGRRPRLLLAIRHRPSLAPLARQPPPRPRRLCALDRARSPISQLPQFLAVLEPAFRIAEILARRRQPA